MPIVSISRIQHRYGFGEDLPQLAAAELGWAIDKRRLYIGNGPTSEGAPQVGNTEILTQYSNILEVAQDAYTYRGLDSGIQAITGPTATTPTSRSLQSKLDERVSVRDYGAKGDGVSNDTAAIQRAIIDLYTRTDTVSVRRVLFFPAGVYLVNETIAVPSFATLQGEGTNSSIIRASNDMETVGRTADSKLQIGNNIGNNASVLPRDIVIRDLSFDADQRIGASAFIINSTVNARFERVGFSGDLESVTNDLNDTCCVRVLSTEAHPSTNITFDCCLFNGRTYGVVIDQTSSNINVNGSMFKNLYKGAKLGEQIGSSAGPLGVKITNSLFDRIYHNGIQVYNISGVISAFNTFLDVGNQLGLTPIHACVSFLSSGNSSICDNFSRLNSAAVQPIEQTNSKNSVVIGTAGVAVGNRRFEQGGILTIYNNSLLPNQIITFPLSLKSQRIYYVIERGTAVRSGCMKITASGNGLATISDTFSEDSPLGITFDVFVEGSVVQLRYTSSDLSQNATFKYSVERIAL